MGEPPWCRGWERAATAGWLPPGAARVWWERTDFLFESLSRLSTWLVLVVLHWWFHGTLIIFDDEAADVLDASQKILVALDHVAFSMFEACHCGWLEDDAPTKVVGVTVIWNIGTRLTSRTNIGGEDVIRGLWTHSRIYFLLSRDSDVNRDIIVLSI